MDDDADRYEVPAWLSRAFRWAAKPILSVVIFSTAFVALGSAVFSIDALAPDGDTSTAAVVAVLLASLVIGFAGLTVAWKSRRKRGGHE